jgi:hypothetical protein
MRSPNLPQPQRSPLRPMSYGRDVAAKAVFLPAERPRRKTARPRVRGAARCAAWQPCRMGLEVRLRVPKAEGAANAPAALKLQELAFGRQVCKRNDDVVPSLLKGGPARVDRISRGMALNQGPAASWLDGPQLVFFGCSYLDHGTSYGQREPPAIGASSCRAAGRCDRAQP